MLEEIKNRFGTFFEAPLLEEMLSEGIFKEIAEGEVLMSYGKTIRSMPILISGAIKVLREDEKGDELLLYFLEGGDTCAMTMTCCLGKQKSEIRATAEMDTKLIMIPIEKMEEWMTNYKSWRNFVLNSYHNRMMEMLGTIDKIAFLKMDERLLEYLKEKAKRSNDGFIQSTHQDIAYELHTSRVVISRLLKRLENDGYISLLRNRIQIIAL